MKHLHTIRNEVERGLESFPGRQKDLRAITRYSRYPRMLYRTDLALHGKRVASSLISVADVVAQKIPDFDFERAITLALVHDDTEIVMGDFQASNRAVMTKEQLLALDSQEDHAIDIIAARFPSHVHGFLYRDLLVEVLHFSTVEAQVVKYLDKIEGFAEAMHEVYAGNASFLEHPPTEFGVPPNPFEYYPVYFADIYKKMPLVVPLAGREPFFTDDFTADWAAMVCVGVPHTRDSLRIAKGFDLYDDWMLAQLMSEDIDIIESLIDRKEE